MIYDIVHANVNVTDIRRSLAFYQTLGFEVIHVFGDHATGLHPERDVMAGLASAEGHTRGAVLSLGDHPRCFTKLELLEHVGQTRADRPRALHEVGLCRLALRCKDIEGEVARLEAAGVRFETSILATDSVGAARYCFFRDPDGTLLELIEL